MGRAWRWIVGGYAALLAASHVGRTLWPWEPELGGEVRSLVLERHGSLARIAWEEAGPAGGVPVVLLHGGPGGRTDLARLAAELPGTYWLLRPDLPGYGASSRDLDDLSAAAQAGWLLAWMEALRIERAHWVAYSQSGAPALELAAQAGGRVASLALVASVGPIEYELLGDRDLNRGLYGLQYGVLWASAELVPHFGLLDGARLDRGYAQSFLQTEQSRLRDLLRGVEAPLLVLHGRGDTQVPSSSAEECGRLAPQAELVLVDGGHFLPFTAPERLSAPLADFLARAQRGACRTRALAEPERLARAAQPFDARAVPPVEGFALLVFALLAALGTLVSEDLTCIGTGVLVAQGRVSLVAGALACFVGIFVGDLLLFLAGRTLGRSALRRAPLRWLLTPERVDAGSAWFEAQGPRVILVSRFLPGARLPTYFAAGLLRTSFVRFAGWFALAAALWTPLLIWLSSLLQGTLESRAALFREHLLLALATLALCFWLVRRLVLPLFTPRGRGLLRSSWTRLARWEYWPPWALYPPVLFYLAWLALRHRSPLAFTAANPAIPQGGFVGESKGELLAALARSSERVPPTDRLSARDSQAERAARAHAFQERHGLPMVVKPDAGQRGEGVVVARTRAELARALDRRGELLLQAYVDGLEYGIFYARHPAEPRGRILSITEKRLPFVVGDGRRTLEELIFADARTLGMARLFLSQHAARLGDVPGAGERVRLGDLGTHCRGATFLDGSALHSQALLDAVDELSRGVAGFHFGRYDVRAESPEALTAGRFRVLELNGVTSEATHIYDPRHSVAHAWITLMAQWRVAYEIGAANARRGARVASWGELARACWSFWRRPRS
jgi:membrane protein DedA with SNARE-associated domain/pimeloyl-ACP methyl ester carboxylesterase